jgi:hypothetical protein
MNRAGRYKLVRQTAGRGYYAIVQIEVSETTNGPAVEIDNGLSDWMYKEYGAAAMDGVHYALQHTGSLLDLTFIHVKITDIQEFLVDTCSGSVAFAACYATWDALGVEGKNPPQLVNKRVEFPID